MTTRMATADDFALLAGLEAALKSRDEIDFVERVLAHPGRTVILGFIDRRPAGYVVLNWQPSYAPFARLGIPEIQDLNVLPADRGNGLGRVLVEACETLARERGAAEMGLAVGLTRSYGPAQRLYARLGYKPDGAGISRDRCPVQPGEIHTIDDDLCLMMVKDIG